MALRHSPAKIITIIIAVVIAVVLCFKIPSTENHLKPSFRERAHLNTCPRDGLLLDDLWKMPQSGYCYNVEHGWRDCFKPHLLYPPRTVIEILPRDPMCLYEPLCWLNLNWKSNNPPPYSCNAVFPLKFYDFSYHDGTMSDMSSFIEKSLSKASNVSHEVFLCNVKKARTAKKNYHYPFKVCPHNVGLESNWHLPGTEQRSIQNWNNYHQDHHFKDADVLIFGYSPSTFEHWLPFNKTILLVAGFRINLSRCTRESSNRLFFNLRKLASRRKNSYRPFHAIGAYSIYDVEYIRHHTGIRPIYLAGSAFDAVGSITWSGSNRHIILNGHRHPKRLQRGNRFIQAPKAIFKGRYELRDLAECKAAVLIPYSINNYKVLEQYAMNIPIFAPTVDCAIKENMFEDRVLTVGPPNYCPHLTDRMLCRHPDSPYHYSPNVRHSINCPKAIPAEKFWIGFADIYLLPCVQYYSSYEDLLAKLKIVTSGKLQDISKCMMQANKWRKMELLQNTCWVTKHMEKNRKMPSNYKRALSELYNTTRLFID